MLIWSCRLRDVLLYGGWQEVLLANALPVQAAVVLLLSLVSR
jgi:hypothetical protein